MWLVDSSISELEAGSINPVLDGSFGWRVIDYASRVKTRSSDFVGQIHKSRNMYNRPQKDQP